MGARDDNYDVIDAGPALIVGAGLAGLFAALKFESVPVTVLSAAPLGAGASSVWAQGGIAAAIGPDDSPALHVEDTLTAGAGIVDERIAEIIAGQARARIDDLVRLGVPFDRDADGHPALGREAAHSRRRIVRVKGDQAGAAIMTALIDAVRARKSIGVLEPYIATDLIVIEGRAAGVWAQTREGRRVAIRAGAVIFALGGSGGLYEVTTNPPQARGFGLAMAARAGALAADPEFVQFHPTALAVGLDPAPLATEALRGEGATLIDERGRRFMVAQHRDAELAPRDIVARGIHREIARGGRVFLDARVAVGAEFPSRFPTVYAACLKAGIDPVTQPIPVAPAAHYHMGGIATDADGRTSIPGLWACGECASTGAHGANRLASNSLLEAIVFGARVASDVAALAPRQATIALLPAPPRSQTSIDAQAAIARLRKTMTFSVGVERSAGTLAVALDEIARTAEVHALDPQLRNMTAAATLIAAAAFRRTESRGGHFRTDYPKADDAWRRRTFITLAEAAGIAASARMLRAEPVMAAS